MVLGDQWSRSRARRADPEVNSAPRWQANETPCGRRGIRQAGDGRSKRQDNRREAKQIETVGRSVSYRSRKKRAKMSLQRALCHDQPPGKRPFKMPVGKGTSIFLPICFPEYSLQALERHHAARQN